MTIHVHAKAVDRVRKSRESVILMIFARLLRVCLSDQVPAACQEQRKVTYVRSGVARPEKAEPRHQIQIVAIIRKRKYRLFDDFCRIGSECREDVLATGESLGIEYVLEGLN